MLFFAYGGGKIPENPKLKANLALKASFHQIETEYIFNIFPIRSNIYEVR